MRTDKTEEKIAKAVAALPYRRPSSGFSARVMAAIARESSASAWRSRLLGGVGLVACAWTGVLGMSLKDRLFWALADAAAALMSPGGAAQALGLAGARAALAAAKLMETASAAAKIAACLMPTVYEAAAAVLLAGLVIAALSNGGAEEQKVW